MANFVTIQRTSKVWKLMRVLSLMVGLAALAEIYEEITHPDLGVWLSMTLVAVWIALEITRRVGAWWDNA